MIQRDMTISEDLVKTFLQFLTHDSIGLRIISFRVISYIIYLRRRVYKETVLDPATFASDEDGFKVLIPLLCFSNSVLSFRTQF